VLPQVPDASFDFVARNQGLVRGLPLWGGAIGFAGLLANRAISGVRAVAAWDHARTGCKQAQASTQAVCEPHGPPILVVLLTWKVGTGRSGIRRSHQAVCQAPDPSSRPPNRAPTPPPARPPPPCRPQIAPVVDASSSQSRADVLGIVMSAVLLLTGLQWLSLKARPVEAIAQDGTKVAFLDAKAKLPEAAAKEIQWWARGHCHEASQFGGGIASGRRRASVSRIWGPGQGSAGRWLLRRRGLGEHPHQRPRLEPRTVPSFVAQGLGGAQQHGTGDVTGRHLPVRGGGWGAALYRPRGRAAALIAWRPPSVSSEFGVTHASSLHQHAPVAPRPRLAAAPSHSPHHGRPVSASPVPQGAQRGAPRPGAAGPRCRGRQSWGGGGEGDGLWKGELPGKPDLVPRCGLT
jgi:hypothetical protein